MVSREGNGFIISWQCDPRIAGIALWDPPVDTSLIVSYDVFFAQEEGGGKVEGGVLVV